MQEINSNLTFNEQQMTSERKNLTFSIFRVSEKREDADVDQRCYR